MAAGRIRGGRGRSDVRIRLNFPISMGLVCTGRWSADHPDHHVAPPLVLLRGSYQCACPRGRNLENLFAESYLEFQELKWPKI